MSPIDRIIADAKRLSARDRRRLLSELERTLAPATPTKPAKTSRRRASLAPILALGGTAHSSATDVSANKYAHLADIRAAQKVGRR